MLLAVRLVNCHVIGCKTRNSPLTAQYHKFSPVASFVFKVQHYNLDITKRIYKCIRAVVFDIHWLSCLYKYIYIYILYHVRP